MEALTDVTRTMIADGLRQLGVRPGDILLLHSSLKSLGHVEGGPQTLIAALQDVLTPDGTLVMPTLTWDTVHAKQPRFDVRTSPSRVGLVTETFRTMPGVRRSLHPTHSLAAWGRLRDALLEGHEKCMSPGPLGSPYHRIVERGGRILFLGCRLSSNTMMHCVEEWAPVPDSLTADTEPLEVVDYDGRVIPSPQHRHAGARSRHYAKMAPLFEAWGCMVSGRVAEADCRLVDSAIMTERTLRLLRQWDRDLFTHDRLPPPQQW